MTPHLACPVHESSQIGDARRQAVRLGDTLGFDEVAAGRLALVVTELATNLVRHAQGGSVLIGRHDDAEGRPLGIELFSLDRGPGMANLPHSLTDGVSTTGTSGNGLGSVRRLANEFKAFSQLGRGTVILARIAADSNHGDFAARPAAGFSVGGICLAAPGEVESGDDWDFRDDDGRAAIIVADGLGHGPEAAVAAAEAVRVFGKLRDASPKDILESAHGTLRSTRGAAVAVTTMNAATRELVFCGAGNISARLISGVKDRSLMSQHGTIGLQIRRLQDTPYEWPEHAILVLHSDGIVSRWDLRDVPSLLACDASVIAGWLIREHVRGRDDATVAVVRLDGPARSAP